MKEYEGITIEELKNQGIKIPDLTKQEEAEFKAKEACYHYAFYMDANGARNIMLGAVDKKEEKIVLNNSTFEKVVTSTEEPEDGYIIDRAFAPANVYIQGTSGSGFRPNKVIDEEAYKEYQEVLDDAADQMEKIIVDHTPDDMTGQKARNVLNVLAPDVLRNIKKGYSDEALSYKTPLGMCIGTFTACVNAQMYDDILVNNINKHKDDFPIYDVIIEGGRLKKSAIDYYEAKEKAGGTLSVEEEKKHRQAIYENVIAMKPYYDTVVKKLEEPGFDEVAFKDRLIDPGNKAFHLHPSTHRGSAVTQASLDAYKMGLENGWPLDDIALISAFYSTALSLKYNAEGNGGMSQEEYKAYDPPQYGSPEKEKAAKKMLSFYEGLKNKPIKSLEDRKTILNEMSDIFYSSAEKGFLNSNNKKNKLDATAEYFKQLDVQRIERELKIVAGKEQAFFEPVKPGNDIKFNEIYDRLNTTRTDKWASNESKYHSNLQHAIDELKQFRENHKAPKKDAGKEAVDKYYSEYLAKLDKVQHYAKIYVDKRKGASTEGGKQRLKGAADMSAFTDSEKKRIQRELEALDLSYRGKNIDQIRVGFVGNQMMNSAVELANMQNMPNTVESIEKVTSLAADIMIGRIVSNGKAKSGSKVLEDIGADMMKQEIMKSSDFKKMMNGYIKDKTMTPEKLVNELSGDGAVRKIKGFSSTVNSANKELDKKAAEAKKQTAKREQKIDARNKADAEKKAKLASGGR
ncbi:hypothetical protein SAMN06297422_10135 [Lachnospiraceae bacterium]|nr:hypothetical protein SAMN06297422_10135 [Lachnospiraceae bacterium]